MLGRFRLLVRPDTFLRWHQDLLARRHAARSRPKSPGRPRTVRSTHVLVLRLARENPSWGYRRVHGELLVLGATSHPTASWAAQAARNLVMDLEVCGAHARFLIRDRDGKFPGLFDAVLKDAGIKVVLSGVQMPRMNSITERWVQTCRHGLWRTPHRYARYLDRSPIPSGSRTSMSADGTGSAASSTSTGIPPDQLG